MEQKTEREQWVTLPTDQPIWGRFFTVAPLVVIGTKEGAGYDLAPKHMVTPLGQDNYFGFVCTPRHATYRNARREGAFTVSFVRPDQVVLASLAAAPRCEEDAEKPNVNRIPTQPGREIDAPLLQEAYLCLECRLDRIVDGFGAFSLIAGKIEAAYVHREALRVSDGDDAQVIAQMPLLAYLPYGRFATIDASTAFPFPKDFAQRVLPKENGSG